MKNLQSFEEFVNENLNESFDPMKPTSLKKLFKGFPVEFSVGDADGRDYNKYIKMWTTNMKDSDKENIMRTIQSTKFNWRCVRWLGRNTLQPIGSWVDSRRRRGVLGWRLAVQRLKARGCSTEELTVAHIILGGR